MAKTPTFGDKTNATVSNDPSPSGGGAAAFFQDVTESMPAQVFLLNSPILTAYGEYSFCGPLSVDEVRQELGGGFVSAIGHQGAAEFLSTRLDMAIPVQRVAIAMRPGDRAVILRLLERLPENRSLSAREVAEFPSEFALLIRQR